MSESERTLEVARAFYDAFNGWDFGVLQDVLAEDIVFELPYSPFPSEKRTEGRDKTIAMLRIVKNVLSGLRLYDINVDTLAADPATFVAEFRSSATISSTGVSYGNRYIARGTVRDGQVVDYAEFFDPLVLRAALAGAS